MSRTQQRWTLLIVFILAVVLAACQPSATPTPTTRPTATTVPPTSAAAGTSESAASTVEATKAGVSLDATLAPIVPQSPTPTSATTQEATVASTEAATAMVAASTEAATSTVAAATEAATAMVAASTEAATSTVAAATEAATTMAASTAEMTAMASPTAEMTMMASPTAEMTSMAAATAEMTAMALPTEAMTMEATSEATSTVEATAALGNIIDVAKADGNFTTLLAALDKAKMTTVLEGDGPFTVFAPTDDAFKALLASTNMTAADLLSNPDLAKILAYHVVGAKVTANDFAQYKSTDNPDLIIVPTMDGVQTLSIVVGTDGTITINGKAKVILKDVQASNGVIHVIDTVLMPPAAEATATATVEATASS